MQRISGEARKSQPGGGDGDKAGRPKPNGPKSKSEGTT
jgi:hypothetical protein